MSLLSDANQHRPKTKRNPRDEVKAAWFEKYVQETNTRALATLNHSLMKSSMRSTGSARRSSSLASSPRSSSRHSPRFGLPTDYRPPSAFLIDPPSSRVPRGNWISSLDDAKLDTPAERSAVPSTPPPLRQGLERHRPQQVRTLAPLPPLPHVQSQVVKERDAFKSQVSGVINERFSSMYKAFQFIDVDRSGKVDRQEIHRALELWNLPVDEAKLNGLLAQIDRDGDAQIDYKEFVDALARDTVSINAMRKRDMQSKEAMGVDAYVETNPYRSTNFA